MWAKFRILSISANIYILKLINILFKVEGVNQESYIYDQAKNIYEKAHQMDQQQETENVYNDAYERDQDDETVNVYSVSEPQCYHREEEDSDNDTYNHLHQKPLQMSDDTYGVPKSISIPL